MAATLDSCAPRHFPRKLKDVGDAGFSRAGHGYAHLLATALAQQGHAVRMEGEPPAIDGRLSDAAWERASAITDFRRLEILPYTAGSRSIEPTVAKP